MKKNLKNLVKSRSGHAEKPFANPCVIINLCLKSWSNNSEKSNSERPLRDLQSFCYMRMMN